MQSESESEFIVSGRYCIWILVFEKKLEMDFIQASMYAAYGPWQFDSFQ